LLIATCLWGVYGYNSMPQRKDPEVQVRTAVALTAWPGASAEKVEQLVTKKVEEKMAANSTVTEIKSISRTGLSVVYLDLDENLKETGKQLDDVKLKLDSIHDLPSGAGPINFIKDFGDTASLMLTVASPKVSELEIELRAKSVQAAIEQARSNAGAGQGSRVSMIVCLPQSISLQLSRDHRDLFVEYMKQNGLGDDFISIDGTGFIGVDAKIDLSDEEMMKQVQKFIRERLQTSEFHPDGWDPVLIRDPHDTKAKLTAVAGDKYSYRELDD